MKQIFQQAEIAFSSISIQDAIVMLPVVDDLCKQRVNQIEQIERREERDANGERTYYESDKEKDHNELIQIEDRIRIMLKLGFVPSSPAMLQNFNMGED